MIAARRQPMRRYAWLLSFFLILLHEGSAAAKGKAKVATLAKCPAYGAEERASSRGLLNIVKHRVPASGAPVLLDVSSFAPLQQQADTAVKSGPNASPGAKDRAKLRSLEIP